MRFAIMAAGAVGAYVGAQLLNQGHDVLFIARGKHLRALQQEGLSIISENGNLVFKKINAANTVREGEEVDVIIFAIKLWDTEEAIELIRPLIRPHTLILTLQNGVESVETLTNSFGAEYILGGSIFIASEISKPGIITHFGNISKIVLGSLMEDTPPQLTGFIKALKSTSIEIEVTKDIEKAIWEKYVGLVAISGATCLTRLPLRTLMNNKKTIKLIENIMEEVILIANSKNIEISNDLINRHKTFFNAVSPKMTSSMLADLEKGNKLELPWLSGGVVKMAKALQLRAPTNQTIEAAIALYENGRPKLLK